MISNNQTKSPEGGESCPFALLYTEPKPNQTTRPEERYLPRLWDRKLRNDDLVPLITQKGSMQDLTWEQVKTLRCVQSGAEAGLP